MKKNLLISACSLLLLCGCTQENLPLENNNDERISSNPNRITLKEALRTSDKLFRTLEGKTRSAGRVVESVSYLADEKTRGSVESVDTMFYIVNYANNQGFAVLSADRRLDPVYAISGSGSLNESDTIGNPALSVFFRQMRATGAGLNDSTTAPGIVDIYPTGDYGYGDGCYKYGPIIPNAPKYITDKIISKMTKINPKEVSVLSYLAIYNACVNKWPATHNGVVYDWDILASNLNVNPFVDPNPDPGVDPDPDPDPGVTPPVIVEANEGDDKQPNHMTPDEFNALTLKTWREFTKLCTQMAPPITQAYADHVPSSIDGGRTYGSDYIPSVSWAEMFRDVMLSLGFAFESDDFHQWPFDQDAVKAIILKHSPVALCSDSNKAKFQNIWVVDGWWSYGSHEDMGGTIAVEYGKEDIVLFHCVWPGKKQNNGWFKISYTGIENQPKAVEPGEVKNTVDPKSKIRYINNRAVKR